MSIDMPDFKIGMISQSFQKRSRQGNLLRLIRNCTEGLVHEKLKMNQAETILSVVHNIFRPNSALNVDQNITC